MDDYKKQAIDWGRKSRKQQSRDAKATMRAEVKKQAKEEVVAPPSPQEKKFEADEQAKNEENEAVMSQPTPEEPDPECGCELCNPRAKWADCDCDLCTGQYSDFDEI